MITGAEALRLPSAQLNDEEASAVDKLMALIDEHIQKGMKRYGVELTTKMTHRTVLTEVIRRLHTFGWITELEPQVEQSRFAREPTLVGFKLTLTPTKEAYEEAGRLALS